MRRAPAGSMIEIVETPPHGRSGAGAAGVVSRFRDRREAGRALAAAVRDRGFAGAPSSGAVVVVGLARGGVEVAAEVAAALQAPLDALAVRKVGHPWQPEYGIGAVAPGGIRYVRAHDGLTETEVAEAVRAAEQKLAELDQRLHERHAALSVAGATCVLVDDGLATGSTMVAAARWARAHAAQRVVVAVPVGARATVEELERGADADTVVCLVAPRDFGAVGIWYDDFRQVSGEDVTALLAAARGRGPTRRAAEIAIGAIRLAADLPFTPHRLDGVRARQRLQPP